MKLLSVFVLFIHCMMAASARQSTARPFTLTGEVSGAKEGILYFRYNGSDGKQIVDSTVLRNGNGQFRFTGKLTQPVMAHISYNIKLTGTNNLNAISFFIEPVDMNISMAIDAFPDALITGSSVQDEYAVLQRQWQKLDKRWQIVKDTLSAINKRSNALFQETKAWALSPYFEEYQDVTTSFIQGHPTSYITAWLLLLERGISTDSLQKLYVGFPEPVKQSSYGKAVAADLEKRKTGIPGAKAAVFTSTGIDGQQVSLADYRGKYVLIDFWASWCVPCRKANPHLKELYARYKNKGFEVIGVASDDSQPDAWKKAVVKDGLPWKHVLQGMKITRTGDDVTYDHSKSISEGYNIHSLPTHILIDPNGIIIGRYGDELGEDHAALDKKLEEIFK